MTETVAPVAVTASRWEHGWDLVIDEENATSIAQLKNAEAQVRDYLDTIDPSVDHSDVPVVVTVDLGGLQKDIAEAKESSANAARLQEEAAVRIRLLAKELKERGISSDDAAVLLGVSRARVYQLLSAAS